MSTNSGPRLPLWMPSERRKSSANLTRFTEYVNRTHHLSLNSYRDLYDWSIVEVDDFWACVWEFAGIRASRSYDAVLDNINQFPGTKWFPGARLNFAENLLRFRDARPALIFRDERGSASSLSYAELYDNVARLLVPSAHWA